MREALTPAQSGSFFSASTRPQITIANTATNANTANIGGSWNSHGSGNQANR